MNWGYGNRRKLESSFEGVRSVGENQDWLGIPVTCDKSLSVNRDHGVLYIKNLYSFC